MNTGQSGSNVGGANGVYNIGWVYRNDGVDVEYNGDEGISYNVGWTEAGEWLGYTIEDVTPGTYDIEIRIGGYGGILLVQLDYQNIAVIDIPNTGGWSNWQPVTIQNVNVSEGEKHLKLQVVEKQRRVLNDIQEVLAVVSLFALTADGRRVEPSDDGQWTTDNGSWTNSSYIHLVLDSHVRDVHF